MAGLAFLAVNFWLYHSIIPPTVRVKGVVYHNTLAENVHYIADRFFFHRTGLLFVFLGILAVLMILRCRRPVVLLLGGTAFGYFLFLLFAPTLRTCVRRAFSHDQPLRHAGGLLWFA